MERDRKREGGGRERIWPDHREDTRSLFWTSQGYGWTLCVHRCLLFSVGPTRLSVKTAKRHPEKAQRLMTLNHWKIQWLQVGLCKWYWWILSRSWISDSIKNLQSKMGMVKREGKGEWYCAGSECNISPQRPQRKVRLNTTSRRAIDGPIG